jgi:hypothetical protein
MKWYDAVIMADFRESSFLTMPIHGWVDLRDVAMLCSKVLSECQGRTLVWVGSLIVHV